jgi:predicted glutamine amidotransferase
VCELLAVAWERPVPFSGLADRVCRLERWGIGGFGWGAAWTTGDGHVRVERGLGRFQDEALGREELLRTTSTRFLVHLRRPNRLSTVQLADTQPFPEGDAHAFCHNGFLERAESLRPRFAGRLGGAADSEVGWAFLREQLAAGVSPADGLREVDETLGGTLNLGYLDHTGSLMVYARNSNNAMWQFGLRDGDISGNVVSTALHSADETLFDVVFPDATDRRLLPSGTSVAVGTTLDQDRHRDGFHPTAVEHDG